METPLASQSASTVYSKEEQIVAFVQAAYPTLDLSPGTALRDLVVRIYAHLETRIQEQIDLALVSSSLSEISKDPSAVDPVQLERVLSNYNVTRSEGSTASGLLRIFMSSSATASIPPSVVFTLGGVRYSPDGSYVLVAESLYTGLANQRILEPSGSLFSAVISVTALSSGSTGNIRASTKATAVAPTIPGTVDVKADSDFTGGADADDNTVLLAKAKDGVVGKALSGREHIRAKLKTQFPGIKDVGVVGFLDPEMSRDLVDGVHTGNRVDLHVKSASYPSRLSERLLATLVSYDTATRLGTVEISMSAARAAGLYLVEAVRSNPQVQLTSFAVVSDIRTMENNTMHEVGGSPPPFTAYQRVTFRFLAPYAAIKESGTAAGNQAGLLPAWTSDTSAPPAGLLNTAGLLQFYVDYLKMPNIREIQAYVDSAAERSLTADMLVRAPVPALCSLQMRLIKPTGAQDPDLAALKAALVSKFNSAPMGGPVFGSALVHVAYQNIPDGYSVDLPIHMYGVIVNPDLTKSVVYSSDALRAPDNPAKGVTSNTCAFFLETSMVDISVLDCP
jgi:hypothetical protein